MRKDTTTGFTLVELVIIMVLLGILAGVAIPRLTTSNYDAAFYKDEVISALRYAKRAAVASQRDIEIHYDQTAEHFFFRFAEPNAAGTMTYTGLMRPGQEGQPRPYQVPAPKGVLINNPPRNIKFDLQGRCRDVATGDLTDWVFSVQANGPASMKSIKIVGETGFIYETTL